jgi:hypothetical protein
MKRLLDVSDGLHAHRKLYRQKLPQVSLPNANGFPALTPLRVTKSFVNFSGLSFDVMVVVAIYIHPTARRTTKSMKTVESRRKVSNLIPKSKGQPNRG